MKNCTNTLSTFFWAAYPAIRCIFNITKKQEPRSKTNQGNDLGSWFLQRSGLGSIKGCHFYPGRIVPIIICTFLLVSTSFSQTYSINTDLQKINIAMFEAKNLYMEIDYNLYFDQTIQSQMKGIVKKNGRNLFQQIGPVTVIKNKEYSVFMHNDQKLIVVDPNPVLTDPIKKEDLFRINIDSLKSWLSGSEISGNELQKTIVFTLKKGEYSKMIIEYDPSTYFIKRMELHTRNKYKPKENEEYAVWMEVKFISTITNVVYNENEFSEKKYVEIQNQDLVKPIGTCTKYKLINNLNKNIRYEKR